MNAIRSESKGAHQVNNQHSKMDLAYSQEIFTMKSEIFLLHRLMEYG